jgi:hypothetical protein
MNERVNQKIEEQAARVAKGGVRWQDVYPLQETDAGRRTDPFRAHGLFRDDKWWERVSDPNYLRSVAVDRVAYLAEPLTETISQTPEGFWVVRSAVIGRTGFQKYFVGEVTDPEGLLKNAGYEPHDEIQLWRDPAEVFSPATIASFEGKSLVLGHPENLLTAETDRRYAIGHLQNVRQGPDSLESGDFPMIADLIVKSADAIEAIVDGDHQLSCGYTYRLRREGNRWEQREIRGNHVAIVDKGRAGAEASIDLRRG